MENLQVTIESGKLQGIHGWDPRVAVFKGIPYAAPPVGELRWKAPLPPAKWEGVRMADQYGPIACQPVPGADPEEFWTREIHPTGPEFEMSEDCLYLNVFTTARDGEEKMPVLFYIHGGGFKGGYPYEVEFDWEHMAKKGIVVVAVAYRLGVMGFLSHPWLSEESPDEPKGNYGLLDQLAALKWVKRNIAAFGGDPNRVTIAGQSAGAMSVQDLMTSSMAEGLINGAVIESSVTVAFAEKEDRRHPLEGAEKLGAEFFEKAGIGSLDEARKMPAQELVRLEDMVLGPGVHFEPVIDGILIKETNFEAYKNDHHHRIPVLAGYNRGEALGFSRMFGKAYETLEDLRDYASGFGEKAQEFLTLCGAKSDEDVKELFAGDAMLDLTAGARMFGYIQASQGRDTYLYEFNADIPGEDHAGSYHGSEMWFAYDGLARCWRPFTGKHYDLARQVSSYWVNFVKTGNPNGKDTIGEELPRWESFTAENVFVMEFADVPAKSEKKVDPLMKFRIDHTLQNQTPPCFASRLID